jgi:hypothetical protein
VQIAPAQIQWEKDENLCSCLSRVVQQNSCNYNHARACGSLHDTGYLTIAPWTSKHPKLRPRHRTKTAFPAHRRDKLCALCAMQDGVSTAILYTGTVSGEKTAHHAVF